MQFATNAEVTDDGDVKAPQAGPAGRERVAWRVEPRCQQEANVTHMKTLTICTAALSLGLLTPGLAQVTFTRVTVGEIVNTSGCSWGSAWGDYDDDGFVDLFVANGVPTTNCFLYRNNGNGTFTRIREGNPIVTDQLGQPGTDQEGAGVGVWGDFDNDGDLDLFVSVWEAPSVLYVNEGGGVFTRYTSGHPGMDVGTWAGCSWADYDRDGWLDLAVGVGSANIGLYHGLKDGTFERIVSGPFGEDTVSLGVAWGDCNNDSLPDLFLSSRDMRSSLLMNDGDGQFHKVVNAHPDILVLKSGWCAWGDYDNDGWLDLEVGVESGSGQTNVLYHNTGQGVFEVAAGGPGGIGPPAWGDYDNDGYLDLAATGGGQYFLFHNERDGTFERRIYLPGAAGKNGQSCPWADYDNDGFLDLFVATGAYTSQTDDLYHNEGNDNHWLLLRLKGTVSNASAIGAKVRLQATIWGKTFWQMREIATGDGYNGQCDLRAHFGLGDATNATTLRIEWPSGIVREFTNVAADQILTIQEPARLLPLGVGEFQILCWKGMVFEVQKSHDLQSWQSLGMVTNETGTLIFQDPQGGTGTNCCFYRAVSR